MLKEILQVFSEILRLICSIDLFVLKDFLDCMIFVFNEVERKPNFDLWLFRVGFPVHGSRPKRTTFL